MKAAATFCLLLAGSVSSSFVPRASMVGRQITWSGTLSRVVLELKGGSEESEETKDVEQTNAPPAPQSPPVYPAAEATPVQSEPSTPIATSKLGPNAPPPGFLRKTFPSFSWHQLPNFLTYVRCVAIPLLMYLFYQPNANKISGAVFAFASFTDWLDGYLARRWDITSPFGAFLDPVADKLMVSTSLILLAGRYGAKVAIPTAVILAREIAVSALREWMAQRGQRDAVKVGFQGKVKTALTMVALTVLLFVPFPVTDSPLSKLHMPGQVMLYLSSILTVTSGSVYFIAAAPLLKEGDAK